MKSSALLSAGLAAALVMFGASAVPAQNEVPPSEDVLEAVIDASAPGAPLPKIFIPGVDLSGRGFHGDITWPQTLAAPEAVESWQKEIGFRGMYRLQLNLWEISQIEKNKALQEKLLSNYESVIQKISDSGATVILDIFSAPQGQGKVLDRTSFPVDSKAFKRLVKQYMRHFSCEKKYKIWYEVWSAPDLDNFFLGRKTEYLAIYRCVAEAAKELQAETRQIIPVGGPSTSWWFRGFEDSTILAPERSLIYELIKFCYHNKLPLDFISWHAYSTDPQVERELTGYNKGPVVLIREWLSYFNFPKETPLIVDEWNYDSGISNVLEERNGRSNVCASYIVSRIKAMADAELSGQVFFSLEDFQDNREGVVRNVGLFWYEQSPSGYKGGNKVSYNAFKMLNRLEGTFIPASLKAADDFSGVIATRGAPGTAAILMYNYADPEAFRNHVVHSIAPLGEAERKSVIAVLRAAAAGNMPGEADLEKLRLTGRVRNILKKAREVGELGRRVTTADRRIRLAVKNISSPAVFQKYTVDETSPRTGQFVPAEEKEVVAVDGAYQETITLKPFSVTLILLKPKPAEEIPAPVLPREVPVAVPVLNTTATQIGNGGVLQSGNQIAPAAVNPTVTNLTAVAVPPSGMGAVNATSTSLGVSAAATADATVMNVTAAGVPPPAGAAIVNATSTVAAVPAAAATTTADTAAASAPAVNGTAGNVTVIEGGAPQ